MEKKVTVAEAKLLLQQAEENERQEREAKRSAYEIDKNTLVVELVSEAQEVQDFLSIFKSKTFKRLNEWFERMKEYGDCKDAQKNFTIFSTDGSLKVDFSYSVYKTFDERAKLAEEKLKSFLVKFVKRKDESVYKLLMSFIERNSKNNELDIKNINRLYKHENDYQDPDWKQAIALFKESYVESGSKYYARFYKKTDEGAWVTISLDFSSLELFTPKSSENE